MRPVRGAAPPGTDEIRLHDALTEEYAALRPGSDFASSDTSELFEKVHRGPQPFSALCISGGGVRSATFALGAIQSLAKHGLLHRFDYLSTVSGGGYIGGWLTAWSNRVGGLKNVIRHLLPDAKPADPGAPDPIAHLRAYNNYLSPRLGALSLDTWTLFATILRNILLNWMVLIPLLMAALIVPRLFLSVLALADVTFGDTLDTPRNAESWGTCWQHEEHNYCDTRLDAISGSWGVRWGLPLLMALLFATATFNTLRYLPGVGNRDHTHADFSFKVLLPLVGAVLAYLAFDSLYYLGSQHTPEGRAWVQMFGALAACSIAWLSYLIVSQRRSETRLRLELLSSAVFVMAAGTGAAIWVTANFILPKLSWPAYVTLGPPAILMGYILGTSLFVGLSSRFLQDEDREWMSRSLAGMLMFCAVWALTCGIVLIFPTWVIQSEPWIGGAIAAVGASSGWTIAFGESLKAKNASDETATSGKARWVAAAAVDVAPAVFIAALAIGLSLATNLLLAAAAGALPGVQFLDMGGEHVFWTHHQAVLERTHPTLLVALLAALLAAGWIGARYININTFSLHGMYRDRLIRAYLGASNARRSANRFTGFARDDNVPMHDLNPQSKPLPVLNLTLNAVETDRLAWQQRKAQPFTVTPLHCGNQDLGYRPSSHYGGPNGISLGTAMAISGAAASPNMGSYSSPIVGLIMTLLNARLGAWLGNPGPAGARTWRHAGPRSAISSLMKEAFGLTSNVNPYVYLSDGGHFENLGVYEMVLRRCRYIVVLDSECDPDFAFGSLGNALRKIHIDLRIPIAFEDKTMQRLRKHKQRWAVARIGYSRVDAGAKDGWLFYVKPMCLGSEPPDVDNYWRTHPAFPHESTSDQWFDESQTESYRMLGLLTMDELCKGDTLNEFRHNTGPTDPGADSGGTGTPDRDTTRTLPPSGGTATSGPPQRDVCDSVGPASQQKDTIVSDLEASSVPGDALRAIERRDFPNAIAMLESEVARQPTAEVHALLALAHFQSEHYSPAALHYAAALALDPQHADWRDMMAVAQANATAAVHVHVPELHYFDRAVLLAPPPAPSLPPGPAQAPPAQGDLQEIRRELRVVVQRMRDALGDLLGHALTTIMHVATHLWGRFAGYRAEVWTNWYNRPLTFAILTLAYMREQLNTENLETSYPAGRLTGLLDKLPDEPPGVRYFRTADGSWNNLQDPKEGAAGTRFLRNVAHGAIRPGTGAQLLTPNPREISLKLLTREASQETGEPVMKEVPFLNLLAASWIQFMNGDWINHGEIYYDDVIEVPLPDGDPARARYWQTKMFVGKTQADPTRLDSGEPAAATSINEVTHWWDGSQIYGSDQATQNRLRSCVDGKLRLNVDGTLPLDRKGIEETGFTRNWWVGLAMLHTLFAREHNAVCDHLKSAYPSWDDHRLFNVARLINAAVMAKIHSIEWTPAILPNRGLDEALNANWYGILTYKFRKAKDRKTKATINIANPELGGLVGNPIDKHGRGFGFSEEFVEVYRLHSLLPEKIQLRRHDDALSVPVAPGAAAAEAVPFQATRQSGSGKITGRYSLADLFFSFGIQHPGQLVLNNYPRFMQQLSIPGNPFFDMGTVDILRARERGVPRYNEFRRQLGLNPILTFEDLTDDASHVRKLKEIYGDKPGDVEHLDLLIGTLAEGHRPTGFGFGETMFQIFILNAARRLQADRFYTTNYDEETYTPEGLRWIDNTDFKTVILRHYPELAATGLANVKNAFEPWDTGETLDPGRHPLREWDSDLTPEPWRGDAHRSRA